MKSILVPIEDHSAIQSVLETAARSAELFGATLTAVPLRAMQFQVVGAEPIVAVSFPPADQDDAATAAKARQIYETFAAGRSGAAVTVDWHREVAIDDIALGSLARVHDLTVVGRPSSADGGARMTTLESVLFDGGRPVLIAPLSRVGTPIHHPTRPCAMSRGPSVLTHVAGTPGPPPTLSRGKVCTCDG